MKIATIAMALVLEKSVCPWLHMLFVQCVSAVFLCNTLCVVVYPYLTHCEALFCLPVLFCNTLFTIVLFVCVTHCVLLSKICETYCVFAFNTLFSCVAMFLIVWLLGFSVTHCVLLCCVGERGGHRTMDAVARKNLVRPELRKGHKMVST